MSVSLIAPYDSPTGTLILPHPETQNSFNYESNVLMKVTEAGNPYFYDRGSSLLVLQYSWNLTRDKMWELLEFYWLYAGEDIKLLNVDDGSTDLTCPHKNRNWHNAMYRVKFLEDELLAEITEPWSASCFTYNEGGSVRIAFIGKLTEEEEDE